MELKAGVVTVENTGKATKVVMVYVPNKEGLPMPLEAGKIMTITTLNAGETATYLAQATDELKVTLATDKPVTPGT